MKTPFNTNDMIPANMKKQMKYRFMAAILLAIGLTIQTNAATYTVINTSDSGPGSLRQAIIDANTTVGADNIVFNIPSSDPNYNPATGVCIITLENDLDEITDAVTIDGLMQPGAAAGNLMAGTPHTLKIEINGLGSGGFNSSPFTVTADNCTFRGLAMNRMNNYCISFTGTDNNAVQTCYIGLDAAGLWADNNTNSGNGIYLEACGATLIGGPGAGNGNVIAGTNGSGILVEKGYDIDGITIIRSTDIYVKGNIIGWNATGHQGGEYFGANRAIECKSADDIIIGGSTVNERNIIANCGDNISFENCTTAVVMGNIIGTGINGNEPGYVITSYTTLPSNQKGISIDDDCSGFQIENNLITGNYSNQIYAYSGTQITISGNKIGTDLTGMAVMSLPDIPPYFYNSPDNGIEFWEGVSNSTIGPGNIISGMAGGAGIRIYGSHYCTIIGNKIGTNLSGNPVLGNSEGGIAIESGNYGESPNNNVIGSRTSGEGNLIAGNKDNGISLSSGINNQIAGNSIFDNLGLGISLGGGRSVNDPNDSDEGANRLQNFPIITGVTHSGSNTDITATLNSTPGASFMIDFYWSPNIYFNDDDYKSYGQGKVYLGSKSVTTDGSGNAGPFTFTYPGLISDGWYVTATATDVTGNTSEFSDYYMFGAAENIHVVTNCYDDEYNMIPGSLRQAILDANAHPGLDYIRFNIPASDQGYMASGDYWSIQPWSDLPQITDDVVIDGYTQPGAQPNTTCMPAATDAVLKIEVSGINCGMAYGFYCNQADLDVTIKGLTINHWYYAGIYVVHCTSASIEGNYIGTDITGMSAQRYWQDPGYPGDLGYRGDGIKINSDNVVTVGGTAPEKRNVISGNSYNGIYMDWGASHCTIQGNFIGTDKTGTAALGNGDNGIYLYGDNDFNLIGGATACSRNIISGNGTASGDESCGIFGEYGDYNDNTIIGNYIGTGATGTEVLGNAHNGIYIKKEINNNTIGGTAAGEGNVITHNGWAGINLREENTSTVSICNRISGNSIFDNGMLGIDLDGDTDNNEEPDGVTQNDPNDTDSGVNGYQNFPVLSTVSSDGYSSTHIEGTINSLASSEIIIEFFSNIAADPSGNGEGQSYLGSVTVTTDSNGDASFSVDLPVGVPGGQKITTTTTLKTGNCYSTSEFGSGLEVTENLALTLVKTATPTNFYAVGDVISYSYQVTNAGNVTLNNISVVDDKAITSPVSYASLTPGASTTFTAVYMIKQEDLNAGSVMNTAYATDGVIQSATDSETVTSGNQPALTLLKTTSTADYDQVGDVIHYTLTLENTGNVSIGSVTITDTGADPGSVQYASGDTNTDTLLDPAETWTYSAVHTVIQTDLDGGHYSNTATADGIPTVGTLTPTSASEDVPAIQSPNWTLKKVVTETRFCNQGEVLHYTLTLDNTGNVSIFSITLTDPGATTGPTYGSGDLNGNSILEPDETWTYTATHTVSQADVVAAVFKNTATAHGKPAGGILEDAQASATINGMGIPGNPSGPVNICAGTGSSYSVAAVPGATGYTWTAPPGWLITAGQGTTAITVTAGTTSGTVCVTANNGICVGSPSCIPVTAEQIPPRPVNIQKN